MRAFEGSLKTEVLISHLFQEARVYICVRSRSASIQCIRVFMYSVKFQRESWKFLEAPHIQFIFVFTCNVKFQRGSWFRFGFLCQVELRAWSCIPNHGSYMRLCAQWSSKRDLGGFNKPQVRSLYLLFCAKGLGGFKKVTHACQRWHEATTQNKFSWFVDVCFHT